jgi:hypothetical protein
VWQGTGIDKKLPDSHPVADITEPAAMDEKGTR